MARVNGLYDKHKKLVRDLEKRGGKLYGRDDTHVRLTEIAHVGLGFDRVYEFETDDGYMYRYVRTNAIQETAPVTESELNWWLETVGRMYMEPIEEELPF